MYFCKLNISKVHRQKINYKDKNKYLKSIISQI